MTTVSNSDNDNLEGSLTPVERHIYRWGIRRLYMPFSFLDFRDKYEHGTIRNAFSNLKKKNLIRLYCRSSVAFYVVSSSKLKSAVKPMTATHMVGKRGVREFKIDLGVYLDSLDWEDVCRVHDVVLSFSVDGIYGLFLGNGVRRLIPISEDIQLSSYTWSKGRVLKVVLHRNNKVTVYLKCKECPVEVSLGGLVSLVSFLGGVRIRIVSAVTSIDCTFEEELVPDVSDWVVVQWHYGRDGVREISGPAFNVTFTTWFNEVARIYMRHCGRLVKPRLEVLEQPRKSITLAFAEKIDPAFSIQRNKSGV